MVAEETSSENAFETTLTAPMGPTDLIATVVTKGALTSTSILTIEPDDDAQREIIRFNGVFGGSTFVTQNVSFRYLPGSAAPSGLTHPSGAIVRSTPTAQHLEDINDRVDALDHGADLAGLGDDDHTQYHTDARGDLRYVELAGDTMTGLLTLSGDPDAALKAATKQYVDTHLTQAEADLLYAAIAHVGSGGTSHADVIAAGADGFMTGADKTKVDDLATVSSDATPAITLGGSTTDGSFTYGDQTETWRRVANIFVGHANLDIDVMTTPGTGELELSMPYPAVGGIQSFAVGRSEIVGHGSFYDDSAALDRLFLAERAQDSPARCRLLDLSASVPTAMTWAAFPVATLDAFSVTYSYPI